MMLHGNLVLGLQVVILTVPWNTRTREELNVNYTKVKLDFEFSSERVLLLESQISPFCFQQSQDKTYEKCRFILA